METNANLDIGIPSEASLRGETRASTSHSDAASDQRGTIEWSHVKAAFASLFASGVAYVLWAADRGPTGFAVFVIMFAILLAYLVPQVRRTSYQSPVSFPWLLASALALGCARLVWQANTGTWIASFLFLSMFATRLHGAELGPLRTISDLLMALGVGLGRWCSLPWSRLSSAVTGAPWPVVSLGVPLIVGILFLIPLLQSDPELATQTYRWLATSMDQFQQWLMRWNLGATCSVCFVMVWSLGVFLPFRWPTRPPKNGSPPLAVCPSHWFVAAQNSLVLVCAIFFWFLTHEFRTMWFRSFPAGFRYSAYAHEGAAWLTLVLAMSTVLLSIIFQPSMQRHPKFRRLYGISLLWSLCNAILVIAVLHRLSIYIDYNGMTRMRIVAFVGVGCVVAGFVLVQWKLARGRSFAWLIRKQCWAFHIAVYALVLIPMDALSHAWNVARIGSNDLRPNVQISHQPLTDEGILQLVPLVQHPDPRVHEGVRAMLAERMLKVSSQAARPSSETKHQGNSSQLEWSRFQASRSLLAIRLESLRETLEPWASNPAKRNEAIDRFYTWSHQWY
jgi:hypothetical protein